jgi:hypothetical protein
VADFGHGMLLRLTEEDRVLTSCLVRFTCINKTADIIKKINVNSKKVKKNYSSNYLSNLGSFFTSGLVVTKSLKLDTILICLDDFFWT